jgi:hypothetical protein
MIKESSIKGRLWTGAFEGNSRGKKVFWVFDFSLFAFQAVADVVSNGYPARRRTKHERKQFSNLRVDPTSF